MKNILYIFSIVISIVFTNCESKDNTNTSADTVTTDSTDNKDETDYGNGSTRTSGNSGH